MTASIEAAASATASVSVEEPWSCTSSARLPSDSTTGRAMLGTSSIGAGLAARRLPGGEADDQRAGDPAEVEQRAGGVGLLGHLVEVDRVADREDAEAEAERDPGAVEPLAAGGHDADDQAEQDHVGQRVGEVGPDRRRVAAGRGAHGLEDDGGADRRDGERGDQAVQPQPDAEPRHPGAGEQDDRRRRRADRSSATGRRRSTGTAPRRGRRAPATSRCCRRRTARGRAPAAPRRGARSRRATARSAHSSADAEQDAVVDRRPSAGPSSVVSATGRASRRPARAGRGRARR